MKIGHRTYLDLGRKAGSAVIGITQKNDELIERVLRAKRKGVQDDLRVAA